MSTFDDASLVFIPSGYKTSKAYSVKPTDGTGDLAFTRSNDTATRVASNGLIEKVRTNLVLQSNSFNTTWTLNNSSVTSGQAGYDGTNNAWRLQATNTTSARVTQTETTNGLQTFSVYAKAGTSNFLVLEKPNLGTYVAWFDLSSGTLGTVTDGTATMTSVGNGWYRCTINGTPTASADVRIFVADSNGSSAVTVGGNILIQSAQLETGDIATPYIATTTAAVSVGPVANVPRLDYLNSSCPRLLLEPQRTNLALYSEQFNNAAWTKSNATITANTTVSPDGTQNADTVVITAGGYIYAEFFPYAAVTGQSATLSVFAKNASGELVFFGGATTAGTDVYKIENYGNGWYRHSRVRTFTATAATTLQYIISSVGTSILWGAQVEGSNSAYATSYIPTLGASVTRGADTSVKTGISSLIGQTEGTVFVDFIQKAVGASVVQIQLNDGSNSNRVQLEVNSSGAGVMYVFSGGGLTGQINLGTFTVGTRYKVSMAYKVNDFVTYINGVSAGTDTSGAVPVSMSRIDLGAEVGTSYTGYELNQALLFKTRLSNSDLAALTA